MRFPEFRIKVHDLIKPNSKKEQTRLDQLSRKSFTEACYIVKHLNLTKGIAEPVLDLRFVNTDEDVQDAWQIYNKYQADQEKESRRQSYLNRNINWDEVINYDSSGFNNETDNF